MDGITSFSLRPLQCISIAGICMILLSFIAIIYVLFTYNFGHVAWGWSSIFISIWLIGGAMLLSLGVIGEYVGKIYREVKRRPRYFVEKIVDGDKEESLGKDW